MDDAVAELIDEQKAYYCARAAHYDDWWLRRGRYDEGAAGNAAWFGEVAFIEGWLAAQAPLGETLELACGTGLWTRRLAPLADRLVAVDASAEVIAINRDRVGDARVDYRQADLFAMTPPGRFDTVVMGFWLSHVPLAAWDGFWGFVAACLKPGERALFVDSCGSSTIWRWDSETDATGDRVQRRVTEQPGGRDFRVVKHRFDAASLDAMLARAGWAGEVAETPDGYFVYGSASLSQEGALAG